MSGIPGAPAVASEVGPHDAQYADGRKSVPAYGKITGT